MLYLCKKIKMAKKSKNVSIDEDLLKVVLLKCAINRDYFSKYIQNLIINDLTAADYERLSANQSK